MSRLTLPEDVVQKVEEQQKKVQNTLNETAREIFVHAVVASGVLEINAPKDDSETAARIAWLNDLAERSIEASVMFAQKMFNIKARRRPTDH